ncbi:hypothetical protein PGT21_027202 [Puccinia graminis f. sp. tritici]|uniref:Uncharacterized protein n=1 Tax=Puccinia graminis f. sp. tritici TaxID=56615 RepID=A0A5B0R291_PUCGR|nr:hypothetical protein PGT21_027202 [Puccinia graminis f. sp. tritici]
MSSPNTPPTPQSISSPSTAEEAIPLPEIRELHQETILETNYMLVEPPSDFHYNNTRATSPVLVERATVYPTPENEEPDIRRRVEDYSHEQVRERDLAVIMTPAEPEPCGRFGFNRASYGYYSPSAVSFSDLPGQGTADSPYYVNTPPPGAEEDADRGKIP